LGVGLIYSAVWMIGYLVFPGNMMKLYELQAQGADSLEAIAIAQGLLRFVAIYVVFDAIQLILSGSLRGAGDTWFVLAAGLSASLFSLTVGFLGEPNDGALRWWWQMVTMWVILLAALMGLRFAQGRWKRMRMV
jgi:MATE family multidrug resistance protein